MNRQNEAGNTGLGLLLLRLDAGTPIAGHGAQKLFGWFGGPGIGGFGGFAEAMGLKPGKFWAIAAGVGEFGRGVLAALAPPETWTARFQEQSSEQ